MTGATLARVLNARVAMVNIGDTVGGLSG